MFGLLCVSLSAGSDGMRMMCCHGDADVMSFLLLLFICLFISVWSSLFYVLGRWVSAVDCVYTDRNDSVEDSGRRLNSETLSLRLSTSAENMIK